MAEDAIFVVRDGELVLLERTPYASEDLLQRALAAFPAVLAGGTTATSEPGPLLLVRREMPIPKTDGGANVWSIDHLFLDPAGVPVLVEVKRSTDTRVRREVIGQMLDYAANGVRYWPLVELRRAVDAAAPAGMSGDEHLRDTFGEVDIEAFWQRVADNLAAGRVRMVFVADALPAELVRVIEFLNEQMRPAEVLGVEVVQYLGGGLQVFVPRLVGNTATAASTKTEALGVAWTEESFLDEVRASSGEPAAAVMASLFAHAHAHATDIRFGNGQSAGVSVWFQTRSGVARPVWYASAGSGRFNFNFPDIYNQLTPAAWQEFLSAVAAIPSYAPHLAPVLGDGPVRRYPSVPLEQLAADPAAVEGLLDAIILVRATDV